MGRLQSDGVEGLLTCLDRCFDGSTVPENENDASRLKERRRGGEGFPGGADVTPHVRLNT